MEGRIMTLGAFSWYRRWLLLIASTCLGFFLLSCGTPRDNDSRTDRSQTEVSISPQPLDLRVATAGVRLDGAIKPVEIRSTDPVQVQVSGIPERIEGPSKPLEVQGGAEPFKFKGDLNLGQSTIHLRWDQTTVPVSINAPPDGIPIRVTLTGWPAKIPLEIVSETKKTTPQPSSSLTQLPEGEVQKRWDDIWKLVKWIFVAGFFGGFGHALLRISRFGMPGSRPREPSDRKKWSSPSLFQSRKLIFERRELILLFLVEIVISVLAAFMVPGPLLLFHGDFLKGALEDPYRTLGLFSLCVIAATIGGPFVDFIVAEADRWMNKRRGQPEKFMQPGSTKAESDSKSPVSTPSGEEGKSPPQKPV